MMPQISMGRNLERVASPPLLENSTASTSTKLQFAQNIAPSLNWSSATSFNGLQLSGNAGSFVADAGTDSFAQKSLTSVRPQRPRSPDLIRKLAHHRQGDVSDQGAVSSPTLLRDDLTREKRQPELSSLMKEQGMQATPVGRTLTGDRSMPISAGVGTAAVPVSSEERNRSRSEHYTLQSPPLSFATCPAMQSRRRR